MTGCVCPRLAWAVGVVPVAAMTCCAPAACPGYLEVATGIGLSSLPPPLCPCRLPCFFCLISLSNLTPTWVRVAETVSQEKYPKFACRDGGREIGGKAQATDPTEPLLRYTARMLGEGDKLPSKRGGGQASIRFGQASGQAFPLDREGSTRGFSKTDPSFRPAGDRLEPGSLRLWFSSSLGV